MERADVFALIEQEVKKVAESRQRKTELREPVTTEEHVLRTVAHSIMFLEKTIPSPRYVIVPSGRFPKWACWVSLEKEKPAYYSRFIILEKTEERFEIRVFEDGNVVLVWPGYEKYTQYAHPMLSQDGSAEKAMESVEAYRQAAGGVWENE